MATTAPVQKGDTVLVGLGALVYTGHITETTDIEKSADIEWVKDENNAAVTAVISNPVAKLSVSCLVKGTTVPSLAIGDSVTINSIKYLCESFKLSYSRGVCKFTISATKPDSMTLT